MNSSQIVFILIGICSFLLLFSVFQKQVSFLLKFLVRGCMGAIGFTGLNFLLSYFGLQVGVNFIGIALVGLFGIWGFFTMIALQLIF